jgi:hypothetical protein
LGTLLACLDATLRRLGGVPTYALTDNEKTVTVEHVAGIPVRHPAIVAAGRHYGLQVHTCVPLVRSSDRPLRQVARELGVNHETLRNWSGRPSVAATQHTICGPKSRRTSRPSPSAPSRGCGGPWAKRTDVSRFNAAYRTWPFPLRS